ncbi:SET domain-containing protein [Plenodomus tracheiphilus IPT5]|uniref:SET domain-containing protein n=1 Tax=Plenodomus tracheiphilus IPT5 TaxID=1408161 RepID=A0A6A7B7L6_9PLEO|nr:SET domain-containing protein [Plenodomus tracheiphilus IPT5]
MLAIVCPERRRWFALFAVLVSQTKAEIFYTATSPAIQDGFLSTPSTVCSIAQDGYTTNTFPWTQTPTCVNVTLPDAQDTGLAIYEVFCAYTNRDFNGGRGIGFVVAPRVAASFTNEAFDAAVGGLEGQIGEEMGMWEVKETRDKGKGLFAKENVAAVFAGETLIVQTPVLLVSKDLLATTMESEKEYVLNAVVENLPLATQKTVRALDSSTGPLMQNVVQNNGVTIKWPWVDEVPQLLAVVPEAARINHACRPNALWRFDDYTMSLEVFALKDMTPGEEITLSYGFESRSSGRRMKSIQANLGFTCRCSLCSSDSDTIEASNDRLSEIKALKSVLPKEEKDTPQLLGLLPSLISQLEQEDLHTDLPMYEEILAYTWSSFGIEHRAKYWAGRARKHWAVVAGKDSWEQRRCGDLENNVKGHSTWMTWEGDPWEDVGKGHPWEGEEGNLHNHS